MKNKNLSFAIAALCIVLVAIYFFPTEAFARAGGGGGKGGGGLIGLILAPFLFIYSGVITCIVWRKNEKCRDLISQIEKFDSSWNLNKIKSRVEIAFFKIQEAWMARDQDIAKDYMSQRLYLKHKAQTDQMIRENKKNILENINLTKAQVVSVADYKDDSKDQVWVHISGEMIDYIINTDTGNLISGEKNKTESFTELWSFTKNDKNEWVLDEIDQTVGLLDLKSMKSFSEELST